MSEVIETRTAEQQALDIQMMVTANELVNITFETSGASIKATQTRDEWFKTFDALMSELEDESYSNIRLIMQARG